MDLRTAETTLEFAEEASAAATGPDAKDALERLETRLDDLLAAMDWFLDAGRIDEAFRVANALYRFWITKQRFAEGAVAFERVLAAPGGDDLLRGKAALYAGMMPFWMGDDAARIRAVRRGARDRATARRRAADVPGARRSRPRGAQDGRGRGAAAGRRGARGERRRQRRRRVAPMRSTCSASAPRSRATCSRPAGG